MKTTKGSEPQPGEAPTRLERRECYQDPAAELRLAQGTREMDDRRRLSRLRTEEYQQIMRAIVRPIDPARAEVQAPVPGDPAVPPTFSVDATHQYDVKTVKGDKDKGT